MTTTSDIIRAALRKIGVLAAGDPLPANEGDDALQTFVQMIDAWSSESLLIPVVNVITHSLIAGQAEYTIGISPAATIPDNHIQTARPEVILSAFIRDGSGTDFSQDVIDYNQFSKISRKSNSTMPFAIYQRKHWPSNTLTFNCAPDQADTLHLELVQPLSELLSASDLTEEINLPPGYERALVFNLALDLADEWGKAASQTLVIGAVEAKKWLKRNNYRNVKLEVDRALTTGRSARGTYYIDSGV